MDSTLTLVNAAPIRLDFSKDNMRNAVLSVSGQPLYQITAPDRMQMRTEVRDLSNNELLFVIKQRDLLPDVISFTHHNNGKERNLKKWLKKTKDTDGRPMHILENEFGTYHWKLDPIHRLVLYSADDLTRHLTRMIPGATPSLWLEAGTERFRDQILASFMVIEREMRVHAWHLIGTSFPQGWDIIRETNEKRAQAEAEAAKVE